MTMTDIPHWTEGPLPDRPSARIIAGSQAEGCPPVYTIEARMHRFVLAEFNTHRLFCLAGDAELEFDLPAGQGGARRVHRMTVAEFVDKWHGGARREASNPKRVSHPLPSGEFTVRKASHLSGLSSTYLNAACRSGKLTAHKGAEGSWLIDGDDFNRWRAEKPDHTRFDIRPPLRGMAIRQLDEDTGMVETSNVKDCWESGVKDVYEVRAGEFRIAGSADHRILTDRGWVTIGDINPGDAVIVRRFGKMMEDRLDPMRLKKVGGRWRSVWQREKRDELVAIHGGCEKCEATDRLQIHHRIAVHEAPELAFDDGNVMLLCQECHDAQHVEQGWQGGTYLYGDAEVVTEVVHRGQEMTYDLEIEGEFPNFLANGIVVHNSRNSESSRAVPWPKRKAKVTESPALPIKWAAEQKGMQGGDEVEDTGAAEAVWLTARDHAVAYADDLAMLGVHKSLCNRLVEPFMWHVVTFTTTELDGFFRQRSLRFTDLAQPEIAAMSDDVVSAVEAFELATLERGEWHVPYIRDDELGEFDYDFLRSVSVARCARTSYLTHTGERDLEKDIELHDRLFGADPQHASPFEHVATPEPANVVEWTLDPAMYGVEAPEVTIRAPKIGNLIGWVQLRHLKLGW